MQIESMLVQHVKRMAGYNQWMNRKLYDAAAKLTAVQLAEDRGAFFGSVLGTLNHIMVADIIWLQRFAGALPQHVELDPLRQLPRPAALNAVLFDNLPELNDRRILLDDTIMRFCEATTDAELLATVSYKNMKGISGGKQLFNLLMHFFNHETHHRGQATTLLSQCGVDVGVTDLLMLVPDV